VPLSLSHLAKAYAELGQFDDAANRASVDRSEIHGFTPQANRRFVSVAVVFARALVGKRKDEFCCFQNANSHRGRYRGPVWDKEAGAAERCEPNLGFVLGGEVSDQKMLRIIPCNREKLRRAHDDLPLIALIGTGGAEARES
jgi:hypothetical protein